MAKPDAVPHRVNVELMDPPPDDKAHNPAQAKYNRSSKDFGGMFPTPSVQRTGGVVRITVGMARATLEDEQI